MLTPHPSEKEHPRNDARKRRWFWVWWMVLTVALMPVSLLIRASIQPVFFQFGRTGVLCGRPRAIVAYMIYHGRFPVVWQESVALTPGEDGLICTWYHSAN